MRQAISINARSHYYAPVLLGVSGWVSLNPYFLWGARPWALILAVLTVTAGGAFAFLAGCRRQLHGVEFWGIALLTLFVIYITLQPRMDGGHSKWVVVLPALWVFAISPDKLRERSFLVFTFLFTLSVVPGILVWLWVVVGLPITFNYIPAANPVMSVLLLHLPGVLFTESNSIVLSWGGVLFRLNAMYDEPGMVGTMAALILAAWRFRVHDWRGALLYVAGLVSFSLAFIVLATVGFVGRAVLTRAVPPLFGIVPLLIAALLSLGYLHVEAPVGTQSSVVVKMPELPVDKMIEITGDREVFTAMPRHSKLRQSDLLDNRALPEMKRLLQEYWSSDVTTILFGIASDASVVRGSASQVWTRHLTNHGLVGFGVLIAGCICIAWAMWRRLGQSRWVALFFLLFAASFYQRPVIWMPYTLLLFFCAPLACADDLEATDH